MNAFLLTAHALFYAGARARIVEHPALFGHGERLEPHDELLKANRSLQIEELPMVALIDDMAKKIMKNGLQTGAFVGSTLNFVDISTNSMSIEG